MRHALPTEPENNRQPPQVPGFLLQGLTLALLACILAVGLLYIYGAFNNLVSNYRREMNASAYSALIYFDRREAQLRAIAASLLPLPPTMPRQRWETRDPDQQIGLYHVINRDTNHTWFLLQSTRNLEQLHRMHARIVHSSPFTGETRYVLTPNDAIDDMVQTWIANFLASRKPSIRSTSDAPMIWLAPPGDQQARLFLFTMINPDDIRAGWIGIEVDDVANTLKQSLYTLGMQNVVLLDPRQQIILGYGADRDPQLRLTAQAQNDEFYIDWDGMLPRNIVLSKSIGEAGWRLVYYAPFSHIVTALMPQIQAVLLVMLVLAGLVLFRMHLVRRQVIEPAREQYTALQETSRLTRTIVEAAPVGLCLLRINDRTPIVSNDRARDWMLHETSQDWLSTQQEAVSREHTLDDGRTVHLDVVPMTYHGEKVILCAISDVSSLKAVEQSLVAAKLKADNANRAKTEFIATMSHEIRTPLFGILGSLELLSLTKMTPKQQQYLRTIQFSSNTLLRTINETLDLSRVESGYAQLLMVELSPCDLVYSVIASYGDRARSKGLRLYCVVDPSTPALIEGDELRLRQILNNLVSNAIKFTMGGHIVLRLRVEERDATSVALAFQVADTGVGIPQEFQDKLFSPYYQIENKNHAADIPGSGLGLFICKRLADMMQGNFSIVSTIGLGTSVEFKVRLPIYKSSADVMLKPATIYVHGGVPEVVQNLCGWLNHWGATAIAYQPGDEACANSAMLLSAWPPAVTEPDWHGVRIAMLPPGQIPDDEALATTWYSNAFDLQDLLRTLRIAQDQRMPSTMSHTSEATTQAYDLRVLVVDDNDINRLVLDEQLTRLGCRTVLAQNGQDALRRIENQTVDFILTDINMPVMDGYTLARTLRQNGYIGPLFGVTASAFSDERQRAHEAGMDDLLLRPLSLANLRDTLRKTASHGQN